MHLDINDPQAEKIKRILLNNKPVLMAVAFDDKEGWIDILAPIVPKLNEKDEGIYKDMDIPYRRKRLFGKVEVVFHE